MIVSKNLIVSVLSLSTCLPVMAQVKKTTTSTAGAKTSTGAAAVPLKSTQDSLSYAIGLSVANFYKQQNITNINTSLVTRAINDVNRKGKLVLNEQQANTCIVNYMQKAKSEKSSGNKKIGEEFLAANKNKPGVVTLPSGLQYLVMK